MANIFIDSLVKLFIEAANQNTQKIYPRRKIIFPDNEKILLLFKHVEDYKNDKLKDSYEIRKFTPGKSNFDLNRYHGFIVSHDLDYKHKIYDQLSFKDGWEPDNKVDENNEGHFFTAEGYDE